MPGIDVHQHLWPEELLLALAHRHEPPCATFHRGLWRVSIPGEPDFLLARSAVDADLRAAAVEAAGLDRGLVALSSPAGVESLPAAQARPLLDAWAQGTAHLPDRLAPWAAVALDDIDPDELDDRLDAGAVGLCLPAGALATPEGMERCGPLLERLEQRLAPLLVHPGPAPWRPGRARVDVAPWWPALTGYIHDVHDAWHLFSSHGRPTHPRLRVVWAFLAGLAPLHAERHAARGGLAIGAEDPLSFYDTSSYGPRALRAMACAVGVGQLVHGTDAPVVDADDIGERSLGTHAVTALRGDNADRLLGTAWVAS